MITDVNSLRQRYEADGFCVASPVLRTCALDAAISGADAVIAGDYDTGVPPRVRQWSPGDDPHRLIKIAEPHLASRAIARVVTDPALGELAARVVMAEMLQVWAVDLFVKAPGGREKANVGWHQDGAYSPYWQGSIFTVWVALSHVDENSSPLRYVRSSHRWGLIENGDLFNTDLANARSLLAPPTDSAWSEVSAPVPRGGFTMHHRHTLHASGPNQSDQPRYALAIRMRTERCQLRYSGEMPRAVCHLNDSVSAPVVYRADGA